MVVLEVTTLSGLDGLGVWWTAVLRRLRTKPPVPAAMPHSWSPHARVASQQPLMCLVLHLFAKLISQGQAAPEAMLTPWHAAHHEEAM